MAKQVLLLSCALPQILPFSQMIDNLSVPASWTLNLSVASG